MTADTILAPTPGGAAGGPVKRRRLSGPVIMLGAAGVLIAFAAVRVLTDANDLTSSGAVRAALVAAVPIGLAGLGGLWAERAGVVNIGLEGMMILGSWFGAWGTVQFDSVWLGVLVGILGGAAGGLLHALATVTFNVDHIVSGVAINIVALGLTPYLSGFTFAHMPGAGQLQSPALPELPEVSVPFVDSLRGLEATHMFLVSDVAGLLRGLLTQVSLLTVIAILLVPLTYFVLWRTPFGLRLRSCGENPHAAETLGVNVYRYKYYGVIISGGLAGLGGAFMAMVAANIYRDGQIAGRGFIGLATMIFGNWRPGGLAAGAVLFGYTDSLQLRGGSPSVHALLLLIAALLLAVAVFQYTRGGVIVGSVSAALAVTIGLWWLLTGRDDIPVEFVLALPYVTTLVVLALASQRLRPPAADGLPYRKGGG